MANEIPLLTSDPWFRSTTQLDRLDGSTITMSFDFKWNARDLSWYFDVLDANEVTQVASVRFVRGVYLGRRCKHEIFRNGVLVATCTVKGDKSEAGFDDLGQRMRLRYFTVYDVLVGREILPSVLLLGSQTVTLAVSG